MSRTRFLIAALALTTLTACGSVRTYRWPLERPASPMPVRPAVFMEGSMPATSMEELEMVEAIGSGTRADTEDVILAMQDEAAAYGASAIVRVKVDCGHGSCHGYGVAVRYLDAAPPAAPPVAAPAPQPAAPPR